MDQQLQADKPQAAAGAALLRNEMRERVASHDRRVKVAVLLAEQAIDAVTAVGLARAIDAVYTCGPAATIRTERETFLHGSRPNLPEQTLRITEDALRAVFLAGWEARACALPTEAAVAAFGTIEQTAAQYDLYGPITALSEIRAEAMRGLARMVANNPDPRAAWLEYRASLGFAHELSKPCTACGGVR